MNIDRELGENEYINPEDGLIYCSICRRPKERIMYFLDEYRHVPVICKCREEEKEQEEFAKSCKATAKAFNDLFEAKVWLTKEDKTNGPAT